MSLDTEPTIITALLLALVLLFLAAAPVAPPPTGGAAKVQQVLDRLDHPARPPVHATLTQAEVNDWLKDAFRARPYLGVLSSQAKFFPGNYVSTYSVVDIDVLKRAKPALFPTPLNMVFSGRSTIWIDFRVDTSTGLLRFHFEKAYINGVRKPAAAIAAMVGLITLPNPGKYNVVSGARMPYHLNSIQVAAHQITLRR